MDYNNVSLGFVLACWKHCGYVEQCTRSILSQPYQNKKVILFGEACTHNIPGVICVNDGERHGRVARLNAGVAALGTDYITFFGVDDYLCPDVLSKVAEIIKATGRREWYYGQHRQDTGGEVKDYPLTPFNLDLLRQKDYIAGGAVFLRRDIALQHGFYGIGKKSLGDDWIQWYRTGMKYAPVVMSFPIYVERIGTTTTRAVATKNKFLALYRRRQYKFRRWLVHMHLVWLHTKEKMRQVDKDIKAYYENPTTEPQAGS